MGPAVSGWPHHPLHEILDAVGANGLDKSRMVVLTALLRQPQICCDVRLLKLSQEVGDDVPDVTGERPVPSNYGKLEMFGELLEEVLDGGHRVLVFCQFTTVLGLLGEELLAQGIEFCYLHGATRDRAQELERFQRETSIPVFLISLKAGGVGLNLTGADTVIHFDPWWNPALEVQATERAHRIGQRRVVTGYKLTTSGTVEEKNTELAEPSAGAGRGDAGRRGTTGGSAELGGNPGSARRVNRKRT